MTTPVASARPKPRPSAPPRLRWPARLRAGRRRARLSAGVLVSLAVHTLLLGLTFGSDVGLPGLAWSGPDRRVGTPDLHVVITGAPVEPLPVPVEPPPRAEPLPVLSVPGSRQVDLAAADPATPPPPPPQPPPNSSAVPVQPLAREAVVEVPQRPVEPLAAEPWRLTESNHEAIASPVASPVVALRSADLPPPEWSVPPVPPQSEEPTLATKAPSVAASAPAIDVPDVRDIERERALQSRQQQSARDATLRLEAEREQAERRARREESERQAQAAADAELAERARAELARVEQARQEATRQEAARQESERAAAQREEAARQAQRLAAEREQAAREQAAREQAAREQAVREKAVREQAAREQAEREEAARIEAQRLEALRQEAMRREDEARVNQQREAARRDAERLETERREAQAREAQRREAERRDAEQRDAARREAEQREAAAQAAAREEAARVLAARADDERREAARRAMGRQLDAEAAARDAARTQSPTPNLLPYSWSSARRGRLFGRADPNAELVLYAEAWARRIQLNTGADLLRELAGKNHRAPVVTVAIRQDGSVESVTLVVSSGASEVDDAVRRIVQGLAPYPAFSPALARVYDVIEIRRTWHFDSAVRLD
jgi:TonB family protein